MAPAFFGFYAYFGILSAWYENSNSIDYKHDASSSSSSSSSSSQSPSLPLPIRSVVGASAGAMAAILIAAGIAPHEAMNFCSNITVDQYADFPGVLSLFRGNRFEELLQNFLISAPQSNYHNMTSSTSPILFMEDALIPVAVTAFDIQTMTTQILTNGPMARAARASATFPGLFQPVGWTYRDDEMENAKTNNAQRVLQDNDMKNKDYLFIDGGIFDGAGTMGLSKTMLLSRSTSHHQQQQHHHHRVIHLSVGSFPTLPNPNDLPYHPEVISISLIGLPQPGPWAMSNGPIAYEIARNAMIKALDLPLSATQFNQTEVPLTPHYHLVIRV
jgi:hypothetical protein